MDAHGVDEQEARFTIAMADGEIEGDVLDGVPAGDKPTLGDVVRGERGEQAVGFLWQKTANCCPSWPSTPTSA